MTSRSVIVIGGVIALQLLGTGCLVHQRAGAPAAEPDHVAEEAPPEPRAEPVAQKPGHVWVRGVWQRRGHRWWWQAGHWEPRRRDYVWLDGQWQMRGNRWHWVEGRWSAAAEERARHARQHRAEGADDAPFTIVGRPYPIEAPPQPRDEQVDTKPGFVWVRGSYRWEHGAYVWTPGNWERERAGFHWTPGGWEPRGERYIWIEGRWDADR